MCLCVCRQPQGPSKGQNKNEASSFIWSPCALDSEPGQSADQFYKYQNQKLSLPNIFTNCILLGLAIFLAKSKEIKRKMLAELVLDLCTIIAFVFLLVTALCLGVSVHPRVKDTGCSALESSRHTSQHRTAAVPARQGSPALWPPGKQHSSHGVRNYLEATAIQV